MKRFRIYIWRDGGFWNQPQYTTARNSAVVRTRLARELGLDAARKSCVTAYADREANLHPSFTWVPA